MAKRRKRITIIPAIHGKLTYDRKVCEPDMAWIIEKWLDRHPEIRKRRRDIRAVSGRWHTEDGLETEVITVSIVEGDEGGWNKYGGRRQIALFGGLFGSKGVIGHISAPCVRDSGRLVLSEQGNC